MHSPEHTPTLRNVCTRIQRKSVYGGRLDTNFHQYQMCKSKLLTRALRESSHLRVSEQQMNNPYWRKDVDTRTLNSYQHKLFHTTLNNLCIAFLITVATRDEGCGASESRGGKPFLVSRGNLSNGHCFLPEMRSLVGLWIHTAITPLGVT